MDVAALEARARELLDPVAYHYFAGGSDDEITVAENEAAWRRIRFLPHVLRDVTSIDATTDLMGQALAAPILVAPMAAQRMAHPDGESGMARAAGQVGLGMVVSTMATTSLEDVAAAAPNSPRWFQLYVHRDRDLTADLVRRASNSGYDALVLTVDVPVISRRRRDEIHRFELPEGLRMENLDTALQSSGGSGLGEYTDAAFDPALVPADIRWLADLSALPILVKGVLRADDAVQAVDAGALGVIVSNHGGRQLDSTVASADALPAVAAAVGARVPVLVDGGIRGGYDIVKAIALGAHAVLVGRPMMWGLAVGGEAGAAAVMNEFVDEFRRTMALCGVTGVDQIGPDLLAFTPL